MTRRRLILLEFNELCPPLLDRWMAEGKLPNFRSFHASSQVFVTDADEPDEPYLEPWIQWYSVHTGLRYRQHGVYHLTDGPAAGHDDIWRMLVRQGKTVGCFASMNVAGFAYPGSFFVPDPWCTTEVPSPPELSAYQRVVTDRVQEYTNTNRPVRASECSAFASFMVRHGLSLDTMRSIAAQLVGEVVGVRRSWRRAPLLDRLQFDVFRHYYGRLAPDFATFFINSTAHYQHAYWRYLEPDRFTEPTSPADQREYENAVLFGYQQMDSLVAKFARLADRTGAMLVLATALSQQPLLKYEGEGGWNFYRARDVDALMKLLGVPYTSIQPVMAHQYVLRFDDDARQEQGRTILERVSCNGEPLFAFGPPTPGMLIVENGFKQVVARGAAVDIGDGRRLDFADHFYRIPETASGRHHPAGVLWFRTGTHAVHADQVSILDILPTLLSHFGIHVESNGVHPVTGRDLTPLFGTRAASEGAPLSGRERWPRHVRARA